jgi:hypothetical protein
MFYRSEKNRTESASLNLEEYEIMAETCKYNAGIVEELIKSVTSAMMPTYIDNNDVNTLKQLWQTWNLLSVALNIYIVSRDSKDGQETNTQGQQRTIGLLNSWVNSSIGKPLLIKLIQYLTSSKNLVGFDLRKQALATLLCVLGKNRLYYLLSWPLNYQQSEVRISRNKKIQPFEIIIYIICLCIYY